MSDGAKDLTPTSVLSMAAPLVFSFWMRAAVTLVDTLYASLIGDAAVAAIGLTIPLEFVMIAIWVGLSTGLTSALSRAMSQRQGARVAQYLRLGWRMVWIVSPLFTLAGGAIWLAAPLMGLDPVVERSFQIYGTVLVGGSAFTTFWSILPDSLVKAYQDTRSTMWSGIWTNTINIVLNTLFLFVFDWGMFGIALSTVLGRIGGLVYALAAARRHERRRGATGWADAGEPDPRAYRAILGLAVPSSLTFALMATETGLINAILARFAHATEAIAAYSIYYRIVLFAMQPVIAISVAMLPFAAYRLGAEDVAGVRRGLYQAAWITAAYALVVVGPLAALGAPWFAARLTESPLTTSYTAFALRAVPFACLAGSPFLLCRPVFEAMQRGRPGLWMALARYVLLTGPLVLGGMRVASAFGYPTLYGLIAGSVGAAALASTAFLVWLHLALPQAVAAPAERPG